MDRKQPEQFCHGNLLRVITDIYPGQLVLSFNTSAVHNKIINKVAEINGVPAVNDKSGIRGPYMSFNKNFILQGGGIMTETANDPRSILECEGIEGRAEEFAGRLLGQL